jgi:predicted RNA-binding Zn ribbon-like protein
MIRVTWEWLGQGPALDLANTVSIVEGNEHDLIESKPEYGRWARSEARFLPAGSLRVLQSARSELMELRMAVRELLAAVAAGERPRPALLTSLNRVSRRAPHWLEIGVDRELHLREENSGTTVDELLAGYARSAMEIVVGEETQLRRCPAPSCGMFFLSGRAAQQWCSTQCGTRARVARYYNSRHRTLAS